MQVLRAGAAKRLLAPKPQLDVLAQLSHRREAAGPLLVGKVDVWTGVHKASALKFDEGPVLVEKVEV